MLGSYWFDQHEKKNNKKSCTFDYTECSNPIGGGNVMLVEIFFNVLQGFLQDFNVVSTIYLSEKHSHSIRLPTPCFKMWWCVHGNKDHISFLLTSHLCIFICRPVSFNPNEIQWSLRLQSNTMPKRFFAFVLWTSNPVIAHWMDKKRYRNVQIQWKGGVESLDKCI